MKYVYKIILLALLTTVVSIAKVPQIDTIDSIDIGLKECRLSINKSVKEALKFGEEGTYHFTITNTGNAPCRTVIVSDRLPNNVQYSDVQGDWTCSASSTNPQGVQCTLYSSLAPLASSQFSINVTIPDQEHAVGIGWRAHNVTNCASVQLFSPISTIPPSFDFSRTSCVTTEVEEPIDSGECRLSINKSVNGELHFDEEGTYDFNITNTGNAPCRSVIVSDTLPNNVQYGDVQGDWTCSASSTNPQGVQCTLYSSLAPLASSQFSINVTIPDQEHAVGIGWRENNVTNCAIVRPYDPLSKRPPHLDLSRSCVTTEVEQVDSGECRLDINKSVRGELQFGEAGEYLIEVSNISSHLCYGIYVKDTLPEGMTYSGSITSGDWDCQTDSNNPQTVTCHYRLGILNPGAVSTLLLPVEIPEEENAQGAGWGEENNVTNCASVYDVYDSRSLEQLYATDCTTNSVDDINNTQDRPFKLKVDTTIESFGHPNTQFQIPTNYDEYTYNYNVDCDSDGINEAEGVTYNYTCHYATPGIYTISISGVFPHIEFMPNCEHSRPDYTRVISLEQWGTIEWKSMRYSFISTINMEGNAPDRPDLSSVEDMQWMFRHSKFNQDISDWDVSHVKNMWGLFMKSEFNENLSGWDVSNVTNMSVMFYQSPFNQDIGDWNVSSVTDMGGMFFKSQFNQDIGDWNVSNVTDMGRMFSGSGYGNVMTMPFNQDISDWNVSNVTNMGGMFYRSLFNQDIGEWNVSSVTNMNYMFYSATAFSNHDLSGWNVENVISHNHFLYQSGSGNTEPIWP